MLYPLKFTPIYKEIIWGGKKINTLPGFSSPFEKTGEAWTVSCRKNEMGIVSNGIYEGQSFASVLAKDPVGMLGKHADMNDFPLLLKIIDANDDLSIQVHPDDHYAKEKENYPYGKNEMWYILDAPADGSLIIGLKDDVTAAEFGQSINDKTVTEKLHYLPVKKGDVIDIPAGLVHAITKGMLLLEIQQNSDITYRIYDYDRPGLDGKPRPLHVDQSLECIDFSSKIPKNCVTGTKEIIGTTTLNHLIKTPFFTIIKYDITETYTQTTDVDYFSIFSCVDGNAHISWDGGNEELALGQSIFIPAALGSFQISGKCSLLKSFVEPN